MYSFPVFTLMPMKNRNKRHYLVGNVDMTLSRSRRNQAQYEDMGQKTGLWFYSTCQESITTSPVSVMPTLTSMVQEPASTVKS